MLMHVIVDELQAQQTSNYIFSARIVSLDWVGRFCRICFCRFFYRFFLPFILKFRFLPFFLFAVFFYKVIFAVFICRLFFCCRFFFCRFFWKKRQKMKKTAKKLPLSHQHTSSPLGSRASPTKLSQGFTNGFHWFESFTSPPTHKENLLCCCWWCGGNWSLKKNTFFFFSY